MTENQRARPADPHRLAGQSAHVDTGRLLRRRLLPLAILLPILAGLLRWEGQHVGLYGTDVGLGVMVSIMIVVSVLLVLLMSREVSRSERTRRRAEEAFHDERFLLETLMGTSPDHIYFKDAEHRFIRISPSLARHFGLGDAADAIGKSDADFFTEEHLRKATDDERRLLREGVPVVNEMERETWPGRPDTWVETNKAPMRDADGKIIGLVGISRDVTERRRVEDQLALLEAQKVESLSALAGGVAHDFNNLLVGVLGNASLALSELPADSPVRATIEEILVAGERMAKLAREMLVYSGRGRFVLQPLDLSSTVSEVAQLLGTVFPAHAQLRLENVERGLPAIDGDEAQIRQVIASLITNAVEALGDEPGTVTVSTGTVDADAAYLRAFKPVDELAEGRYAFVEVADTGRGIGPEAQSRIFEPFFTTKFTGRGLGLAALLGIVRGHRGGVRVDSDLGRGAVFTAIFPLSPTVRRASATVDPGERAASGGIVLVADDDQIVRAVTAQMIERAGFNVVTTSDGEEALEVFRARSSEILAVVLDLVMPGRSGEDVLAEIHSIRPDVPVLMCSGYSKLEDEGAPANDLVCFIPKPYTNDVLIGKLQELLARAVH